MPGLGGPREDIDIMPMPGLGGLALIFEDILFIPGLGGLLLGVGRDWSDISPGRIGFLDPKGRVCVCLNGDDADAEPSGVPIRLVDGDRVLLGDCENDDDDGDGNGEDSGWMERRCGIPGETRSLVIRGDASPGLGRLLSNLAIGPDMESPLLVILIWLWNGNGNAFRCFCI
jgi:hypothetical protein